MNSSNPIHYCFEPWVSGRTNFHQELLAKIPHGIDRLPWPMKNLTWQTNPAVNQVGGKREFVQCGVEICISIL